MGKISKIIQEYILVIKALNKYSPSDWEYKILTKQRKTLIKKAKRYKVKLPTKSSIVSPKKKPRTNLYKVGKGNLYTVEDWIYDNYYTVSKGTVNHWVEEWFYGTLINLSFISFLRHLYYNLDVILKNHIQPKGSNAVWPL